MPFWLGRYGAISVAIRTCFPSDSKTVSTCDQRLSGGRGNVLLVLWHKPDAVGGGGRVKFHHTPVFFNRCSDTIGRSYAPAAMDGDRSGFFGNADCVTSRID